MTEVKIDSTKKYNELMQRGKDEFDKVENPPACNLRDTTYSWEGSLNKAKKSFEDAVDMNPFSAEAHYYLGYAYDRMYRTMSSGENISNTKLDDVKKISEQFQRVIELRPNYSTPLVYVGPRSKLTGIWGSLAMAYIARGENDSAKWAFMQGQKSGGFPQAILEYCRNILTFCEQNAILFVDDNNAFPILFLQFVEGYRKDVTIFNIYLFNKPWYVKMNRDLKPSIFKYVKMMVNDKGIEEVFPIGYNESVMSLDVPPEVLRKYSINKKFISKKGKISWTLKPTLTERDGTTGLWAQDQIMLDIIRWNQWEKPIYFTTCMKKDCMLSLHEYLRIEGLVFNLTPVKEKNPNKRINLDRIAQLLSLNKSTSSDNISPFSFQGLKDKTSMDDIDVRGFVMSQYISLFIDYAKSFDPSTSLDNLKQVLHRMEEVIPLKMAKLDQPIKDELLGLYKFIGEEARLKMLTESNSK